MGMGMAEPTVMDHRTKLQLMDIRMEIPRAVTPSVMVGMALVMAKPIAIHLEMPSAVQIMVTGMVLGKDMETYTMLLLMDTRVEILSAAQSMVWDMHLTMD